jgi:AAA domain
MMTKIFRATASLPPIIVLHGLPGIGKTTLAQNFPNAVFLQCEDGIPSGLEIATFGLLESYPAVVDALKHLGTEPHDFSTVVIDSIDKLEPLIFSGVCSQHGYTNIESPGFGKGYVQADSLWLDILRAGEWLRRTRGMMIVLLAHSEIVTINDPRVASYASYQLRLHKRARGLVEDAADLIGFLATDVVVKSEQGGFGKTRARADGGSTRWLHTEGRPAFVAKNRYAMPERIAIPQRFDYPSTLGKFFPQPQAGATTAAVLETTENVT